MKVDAGPDQEERHVQVDLLESQDLVGRAPPPGRAQTYSFGSMHRDRNEQHDAVRNQPARRLRRCAGRPGPTVRRSCAAASAARAIRASGPRQSAKPISHDGRNCAGLQDHADRAEHRAGDADDQAALLQAIRVPRDAGGESYVSALVLDRALRRRAGGLRELRPILGRHVGLASRAGSVAARECTPQSPSDRAARSAPR